MRSVATIGSVSKREDASYEGERVGCDQRSRTSGPRRFYANLGRLAGHTDPDVYALTWNPQE